MGERRFQGVRFGTLVSSAEHLIARTCAGIVPRSRAVKELQAKITIDDLDKISGMPWALTGVVFEKVIVPSADSKIVLQKTQEPLTFVLRQCFSHEPHFSDLVMLKLGLSVEHFFVVSIPQHSCNPQSVVNDWQCLKT